jgi:hypothetical protein
MPRGLDLPKDSLRISLKCKSPTFPLRE